MSRLMMLPDELLLNIIERVRFEDIERLTSCCKELKSIGQPRLQDHLMKKRAYTSITCGPSSNSTWPDPFKLLREIWSDDEHAHYTTSLRIKNCRAKIEPHDPYGDHYQVNEGLMELRPSVIEHPDLTGMMDTIAEKLRQCKYITSYNSEYKDFERPIIEELWVSNIVSGRRPDSAIALLIVGLPNLQTLKFSDESWDATYLQHMISRVCWESHRAPEEPQSLSNLKTVTVEGTDDGDEDAGLLLLFSLLPSVHCLTGKYLSGYRAMRNTIWRDRKGPRFGSSSLISQSSLTEISIEQSLLSSQCFEFLERVPKLRHFKYSHADTGHVCRRRWWEPSRIVTLLTLHACHSLVSLDLTGTLGDRGAFWNFAIMERYRPFGSTFIGSLAKFEVLTTIRIDHDLFIDNDVCDKDGSRDFRAKHCVEVDTCKHVEPRSVRERVHSLVDMLPASVETLSLVKPFESMEEAVTMFAGLLEARDMGFLRLSEITLEGGMLFEQDTVDAYKEAGIELK